MNYIRYTVFVSFPISRALISGRATNMCQYITEYFDHLTSFLDVNECLNTPCANAGTCENSIGSYSCSCTGGWEGSNCQTGKIQFLNTCVSNDQK